MILTEIENGNSFEEAVKKAQDLGIAETDPSFDVDGWDAAVKVSALATVLDGLSAQAGGRGARGHPRAEPGAGAVGEDDGPAVQAGVPGGEASDGTVVGRVRPEQVPLDEPLAGCDGATSIILFQMDMIHGLTLSEIHPDAVTTAYGPLADFITIARGQQTRG